MGIKGTNDQTRKGPLGGAPGQGRPPKHKQLQNYDKVLKILDDNAEKIINTLVKGLDAEKVIYDKNGQYVDTVPDNYYRFNCATVLLKKILPDKKTKEITGPGGKELPPTTVIDNRKVTMTIVDRLDEMSFDELKEAQDKGEFKLLKKDVDYYFNDEDEKKQENANQKLEENIKRTAESKEEGGVEETETED